jgi:hypothetical protein
MEWAATTAELGSSSAGGGVNMVEKKEPIALGLLVRVLIWLA